MRGLIMQLDDRVRQDIRERVRVRDKEQGSFERERERRSAPPPHVQQPKGSSW